MSYAMTDAFLFKSQDMLWAVLAEHDGLEIRAPRFWVAVATRLLICGAGAVVGYLVRWTLPGVFDKRVTLCTSKAPGPVRRLDWCCHSKIKQNLLDPLTVSIGRGRMQCSLKPITRTLSFLSVSAGHVWH